MACYNTTALLARSLLLAYQNTELTRQRLFISLAPVWKAKDHICLPEKVNVLSPSAEEDEGLCHEGP